MRILLICTPDEADEIRRSEQLLQNEKAELSSVMNSIDMEYLRVTYDVDMNMLDLNDTALKLLGYPREQLIGTKITDKMHPAEASDFTQDWNEILSGKIIKGEGERLTANGTVQIRYMYSPLKDTSGKTAKVMMMGQLLGS
jgi:PAS domain S-box-containing protein